MINEGDDEKFKGLESGHKFFSKCVFGLICIWVLLACISWESTLIFGNSKKLQQSIEVTGSIIQKKIMVFCKTFETVTRGSGYVLSSCFYILSSGRMVLGTLDYVIYVGWRIFVTKCKQEFEFPWKSNVVLGSCGFKDFGKKKKACGLKKERSERSYP
jgi:hypothetical protein